MGIIDDGHDITVGSLMPNRLAELGGRITRALGAGALEEEDLSKQLTYSAVDLAKMGRLLDCFNIWDAKGKVKEELLEYCTSHHITPLDLADVFAKIVIARSHNMVSNYHLWKEGVPWCLMLPTFRGGKVVTAALRAFSHTKEQSKWVGVNTATNGRLLYTATLRPAALAHVPGSEVRPLVLVESPIDAIRVSKLGWDAVALGGHDLPAKIRGELHKLPHTEVIILLDSDAQADSVNLQSRIAAYKPFVTVALLLQKNTDPADLNDMTLVELLSKAMEDITKQMEAKRAVDIPTPV